MEKQGSLVIVGTGINTLAHCSIEARAHIEQAEKLIVHVPDPLGMSWLRELQPDLIDLQPTYKQGANRADAYELMVRTIVEQVEAGFRTVAVFYGHPGVFVSPSHEAIERLQKAGFSARMLPGISAEDCLFADLGIDPAKRGCAQYEATRFLFYTQPINTAASLIIWQLGVVGDHTLTSKTPVHGGLTALQEKLLRDYPASHRIAIYEAPTLAIGRARMDWFALADLREVRVSQISTLFIPALRKAEPDWSMLASLGLTLEQAFGDVQTV